MSPKSADLMYIAAEAWNRAQLPALARAAPGAVSIVKLLQERALSGASFHVRPFVFSVWGLWLDNDPKLILHPLPDQQYRTAYLSGARHVHKDTVQMHYKTNDASVSGIPNDRHSGNYVNIG
jgi:hypothetical protein